MKVKDQVTYKFRDLGIGTVEHAQDYYDEKKMLVVSFKDEKIKGFEDDFEIHNIKGHTVDIERYFESWDKITNENGELKKRLDLITLHDSDMKTFAHIIATISLQEMKKELFEGGE